jgi:hypothetical protein
MKTLIRKAKLSFVAMFWGWFACNGVFLLWATYSQPVRHWNKWASDFIFICICTGIVIMAAWLAIFLPVDLTTPDHSRLRQPRRAAICGFLAVILPSYAVLLCACLTHGRIQSFEDLLEALMDPSCDAGRIRTTKEPEVATPLCWQLREASNHVTAGVLAHR